VVDVGVLLNKIVVERGQIEGMGVSGILRAESERPGRDKVVPKLPETSGRAFPREAVEQKAYDPGWTDRHGPRP
jgi:hypothetical protein